MIDFHASAYHHFEHLAPIWNALNPSERGTFTVARSMAPHPARSGIRVRLGFPSGRGGPVVIGSWYDVKFLSGRPFVMVEHGAGQGYNGGEPAADTTPDYAHSCGLALMLCPNERVAHRNRLHHPHARIEVVGSAKVESWKALRVSRSLIANTVPVVAFAWHWSPVGLTPEATSAFPHWRHALSDLAGIPDSGFRILGHGHPKAWRKFKRFYDSAGIDSEPDGRRVIESADVVVFDTTSFGFESAAAGIPVVVLDAPWYRTAHGFRFFDCADVGVRCGSGKVGELRDAIELTLSDDPAAGRRAEVVAETYPLVDGSAAASVGALRNLFGNLSIRT